MSTPRITVCRLVCLLLLPGCHTWRPVTLAPNTGSQHGEMRLEKREHNANSVVTAGDGSPRESYSRVHFHGAWVDGDTLFGWQSRSTRQAVSVADIRRAEERHISAGRTTLLVLAVPVVIFAGLIGLLATGGPMM